MKIRVHSHRNALDLLEQVPAYKPLWIEIKDAIETLSDERLINYFENNFQGKAVKSLSRTINNLLDEELVEAEWTPQSQIFGASEYGTHTWRLDFAKQFDVQELDEKDQPKIIRTGISIEVAFNHAGNIAWNLLKPVIASEINHVEKNLQTSLGIVIAATDELKLAGGFDNAVGTYEQFVSNLLPLRNFLTVPVLVIGLEAPETFKISHQKKGTQTFGFVDRF